MTAVFDDMSFCFPAVQHLSGLSIGRKPYCKLININWLTREREVLIITDIGYGQMKSLRRGSVCL